MLWPVVSLFWGKLNVSVGYALFCLRMEEPAVMTAKLWKPVNHSMPITLKMAVNKMDMCLLLLLRNVQYCRRSSTNFDLCF